jgi:hypothetical protein
MNFLGKSINASKFMWLLNDPVSVVTAYDVEWWRD